MDENLELPASVSSDSPLADDPDFELPEPVLDSDIEDGQEGQGKSEGVQKAKEGTEGDAALVSTQQCTCKFSCFSKFEPELVEETRLKHLCQKSVDKRGALFAKIRAQLTDSENNVVLGRLKLSFQGQRVCKGFWLHPCCWV